MKNLYFEIGSETRGKALSCSDGNTQLISDCSQRIEKAVQYMTQHLHKPLQVSELAAVANISLSHFFALFKQRIGCSPMDYFTRLRMRRACDLLESTSARVKEIAAALGYDDPLYFSRVFKSLAAVAPLHYRNLGLKTKSQITELLEPARAILINTPLQRGV